MLPRKPLGFATIFGILVTLSALALPEALRANSVEYTFTGQLSPGVVESFQLIVPDFITSDVYIFAANMVYCTTSGPFIGPCVAVGILPSGPGDPQHHPQIIFETPNTGNDFYFPYGSFSAFGQYSEVFNFNPATLSVTEVPTPTPEPEPSSLLLIAGLAWALASKQLPKRNVLPD
jgi:hypothetical protein